MRLFTIYSNNKTLIKNRYNLSCYNENVFFRQNLKQYYVFKDCDFRINQYYWTVKTNDSKYFYTNHSNPKETVENIFKTLKIPQLKTKMVNNFFEYCLISYLVKEDINLLKELRRGNPITTSNVVIKTHEFFERDDRILIEGEDYFNLPDIFMASGDEKIIIQVYDGVPNKDIMDRFESFELDQFNNSKIYVFASCISSLEMLKQKKNTFKLFHVNQKEQSIKEVFEHYFWKACY